MPDKGKVQEYLQVQVKTASKEQLLLMLLDGAVRFIEVGRDHMARGNREAKSELLLKAQNIILELIQSLNPAVGEALYKNLIGLYKFIYRRLVEGNLRNDAVLLDEGLKILLNVRETWRQAVATWRSGTGVNTPVHSQAPIQNLSLQA